jgi:Kef-type K+ transport system membrane component KefB
MADGDVRELRDELKNLNKSIKRSNIMSGRLNILLFIIAFCQLFIAVYQLAITIAGTNPEAAWIALAISVLIGCIMYYFLNDYIKTEKEE